MVTNVFDKCIASIFWAELNPEDGGDMFLQNDSHQQCVTTRKTKPGNYALGLQSLHQIKRNHEL
jgi:hypothetical protein